MTKGYVVRGKWGIGRVGAVVRDVYVWWWDLVQDVQWITDREKVPADGRLLFPTIGEADAARCKSSHLSGVAIFRVHPDGREERLPSYEEALALLGGDPLAALEAAERRLLESARWTPGDRGFWIDPDDGTQWPREGAISDVRRRLAAKGGV